MSKLGSENMKILVLSSAPINTGSALRARYIAKALRKQGNDIFFIEPIKGLPYLLDYGVSLPIYTIKSIFKKCDVAIAVKPFPNGCIPILFKKLGESKAVVDIDDLDYGYRKGIISLLSKLSQAPFPRRCDLITTYNQYLEQYILDEFKVSNENIYRLDVGVDLSIFNPLREDIIEFSNTSNLKDENLIVYTGHLNIACYLDKILKAFKNVLYYNKKVKLLVVGGGPLLKHYQNIVNKMNLEQNVLFTGYVEHQDIPKYISIANICILYHEDNYVNYVRSSTKIREYLAMGKKVVCNDVGELKLFKEYTYQSSSNIKEFSEEINHALEDTNKNKLKLAQKFIKDNYSWDIIGKKFNKKLTSIIE